MKNYNIKAALFDLDGVIVFTDKYHFLAWKQLADEEGWKFDEQVNNRLRGIPRLASLNEILKYNGIDFPMEKKVEFMDRKNKYYVKLLENINEGDVYPGVVDFIKNLRKHGTLISLCSSSKNAMLVLAKLGLTSLFDAIVTGHDIKNAKPDPEIFLLGAERLNVPPFHCCVFEDARAGIMGAKAAKMKNVGVGNRLETEDIADQFIMNYNEIDVDTFLESGNKQPLPEDEWKIIEKDFNRNEIGHMESIYALGNGYMGLRGTYDEQYTKDIITAEIKASNGLLVEEVKEKEKVSAGQTAFPKSKEFKETDGMYLNGIYAQFPIAHLAKFVGFADNDTLTINICDWRIFELYIDGERASFVLGNIKNHVRTLDMKRGLIERTMVFETKTGKRALVKSERLVDMTDLHSALVRYSVVSENFDGIINIKSKVNKNGVIANKTWAHVEKEYDNAKAYTVLEKVDSTNQSVSASIRHEYKSIKGDDPNNKDAKINSTVINTKDEYVVDFIAQVIANTGIEVTKFASFACTMDGFEDEDAMKASEKYVVDYAKKGVDAIFATQAKFWDEHWKYGDIEIEGNVSDQQAVRFSLFVLRQQLALLNQSSIGATGLSGPNYSGKVFWDTEMYLMPYYNYLNPDFEKGLMMYRYRILEQARERAKTFGVVGAQYAWCGINGEETSIIFEASTAEYHLHSDIAYSIWRYYDSTGDKDFVYKYGAEIVFDTARFMAHRGFFCKERGGKFVINAVCGPDEYTCGVNNNMYTNIMARFHFNFACKLANEMKKNAPEQYAKTIENMHITNDVMEEELKRFKKAADNMYFKYNEELGIHEQDDSYIYLDPVDMTKIPANVDIRGYFHPLDLWRMQVSKQADVCLLNFIQGDLFTKDEKLRNYNYYEPRCNHGSSLSPAIYSIMATELGKKEAYEFFRCTAYMDISDFKHNTDGGVHIACLGGVWMTVMNGFLGMRHYTDGIIFEPHLPKAWKSFRSYILYKGARFEILVERKKTTFTLVSGDSVSFKVCDELVKLDGKNKSFVANTKSI